MSTVLVGVDTGVRDLAGVDHVVHRLDEVLVEAGWAERPGYVASTHVVSAGGTHHAVAAGWAADHDDPALMPGLLDALAAGFPEGGVVAGSDPRRTRGPDGLVAGAVEALARHVSRESGRLARFPGQAAVERRLSVAEVIAGSCVDEVSALAGTDVGPDAQIDLTGFVRPTWRDGRCTVLVQSAASGLVPFEARHQIACCSNH